jgi:hypothetical protein
MHLRTAGAIVVVAASILACGDATSPARGAKLTILGGAVPADTVLASVPELLRVEVRDSSGNPAPHVLVRFRAPSSDDPSSTPDGGMYVCDVRVQACAEFHDSGHSFSLGVDTYSDAAGIVNARLEHGMTARSGAIQISAPSLGLSIAKDFATLPGQFADIALSQPDTAVYAGASYALEARAVDRFGNVRTDAVTAETLTPGVATLAGGRVTAVAVGRGSFAFHVGGAVQTAYVSVPPHGRLAARGFFPSSGVTLLDTDGGSRRSWSTTTLLESVWWSLDGRQIIDTERGADGRSQILAYDTATMTRTALVDTIDFEGFSPSFAQSGAMYFYAIHAGSRAIYRAAPGGGAPQLVQPDAFFASVAPDESALLLQASSGVVNRSLSTGEEKVVIGPTGYPPFWSSDGTLIGYMKSEGGVFEARVVRPDGSGDRLLATGIYDATSFSPDGQWMVVSRATSGLELVRVSDGLRLPIAGTRAFGQAAWRPN